MQESRNTPIKRKKRKKKTGFRYLVLFAIVFILALYGLSYLVKSLSPEVDVAIGNNESYTLNDNDNEIKTVDERLRWIQMEDELPSVAIRMPKEKTEKTREFKIKEEKEYTIPSVEKVTIKLQEVSTPENSETKKQNLDIKINKTQKKTEPEPIIVSQIPLSKPAKVYVGQYSNVEEAIKVQHKLTSDEPGLIPFIKSVNGYYVVQAGSFSDKEKALSLVSKLNSKGYSARVFSEK